jgi:hypothetical protein
MIHTRKKGDNVMGRLLTREDLEGIEFLLSQKGEEWERWEEIRDILQERDTEGFSPALPQAAWEQFNHALDLDEDAYVPKSPREFLEWNLQGISAKDTAEGPEMIRRHEEAVSKGLEEMGKELLSRMQGFTDHFTPGTFSIPSPVSFAKLRKEGR